MAVRTARRVLAISMVASGLIFPAASVAVPTADAERISHAEATRQLTAAGIPWVSPDDCADRDDPRCTSFEQVRQDTISGAIVLKKYSGCAITVTGATETGHSTSTTYSHWNGWKLDYRLTDCLESYVREHFTYAGVRGDGYPHWKASSGNIYTKEATHWDVLYYAAGG
ncbi:hypothetical protein [Demetria terragena]|uniref:hypothetical protein n=1 Tax=Demetria terragena TaxID=63959 RepID=UPI000378F296|nr:hypothetical protein [Demetria terragena]